MKKTLIGSFHYEMLKLEKIGSFHYEMLTLEKNYEN